MACQEQKELANFIKNVHQTLRQHTKTMGADEAWNQHLQEDSVLSQYAEAMRKLSQDYWDVNNSEIGRNKCRIQWMVHITKEYFYGNGKLQQFEKEKLKHQQEDIFNGYQVNNWESNAPLKLLDVGSCYDPFRNFEIFETYPIDIAPASESVHKCDFLNVNISGSHRLEKNIVNCLPEGYFDVVVFSLFLEYLPTPEQRYNSCCNAYLCLKTEGLLLIATPDSNHASSNSPLMKKWRLALSDIGFNRISLEKLPHLYCMAYRKSIFKVENKVKVPKVINIPQDFNTIISCNESNSDMVRETDEELADFFDQLPFSA